MTFHTILTLLVLILLQAVLGIDNLLYISLESKHAPENKQRFVRMLGISIAIVFRFALLYILLLLIDLFQNPIFDFKFEGIASGQFNIHSLIVYFGGGFIVWTAIKEIWHMITFDDEVSEGEKSERSVAKVVVMIVLMNIVFSFDTTLAAIALTRNIWIMIISTLVGGVMMIWLSEKVSMFLKKNRMYEVLGLFILLLVGIMLITEAGHLSHLILFGEEIQAMSNTTFYFILVILIVVDLVQTRYQKKLTQTDPI